MSGSTPTDLRYAARPTVCFLDFDDVVALNTTCGGYDVALAIAASTRTENAVPLDANRQLWDQLFDGNACEYLRRIHEEFCPAYVLTTSWWWLLNREALELALRRGGLAFVADHLHPDWATPKALRPDLRSVEIDAWLNAHRELANAWVVLDDDFSGTGLIDWPTERHAFIALCRENVGLTEAEYIRLRKALLQRMGARCPADLESST